MRDNNRDDDGGSKQKQNQLKKSPLKKTKTVPASSTTHLRVSVENAIAVEEQWNFPSFLGAKPRGRRSSPNNLNFSKSLHSRFDPPPPHPYPSSPPTSPPPPIPPLTSDTNPRRPQHHNRSPFFYLVSI
ncbi:hypothetical protein AHAS_Ahas17G0126300 [Arachis hypogaea]